MEAIDPSREGFFCFFERKMGLKEIFGFGSINNNVFFYSISTAIAGIGAGIVIGYNWKLNLNIGWILLIIGTILANVAHSKLKKKSIVR